MKGWVPIPSLSLVDKRGDNCLIAPACGLPRILDEAMEAFLRVLDSYSLSDIANRPGMLRDLFHDSTAPARECDREGAM